MDIIFPLKSKKAIKAINQAVSNNNAMMRLKMKNALYQQELNKAKAALALAQHQQQQQQHDAIVAAASAQRQQHEATVAAALAQHHQASLVANKKADVVAPANKQPPVTNLHNKKSPKFSKLLSNMNKHH